MTTNTSIARAWAAGLYRGAENSPLVSPLLVFEYASVLRIVDLRGTEAAAGLLGHIPGCQFMSATELADGGDKNTPLVLVSRNGGDAREAALRLEKVGYETVAAMDGGLVGWRRLGLRTSRNRLDVCDDEGRKIAGSDTNGAHLTLEQVRDHIGKPGSVHWIQTAALAFHANTSCVDGRDQRRIIGAPGGDMGEFVLTLTAIEKVSGKTLTREQIQETLLAHIDTFGDFYMHSDVAALKLLIAELRADSRFEGVLPEDEDREGWQAFLRSPPANLQDPLIEHFVEPENVGCGHLKLMMLHPEDYGVRAELVSDAIKSFVRLLWAGVAELRYVVLFGGHSEGAVVEVKLEEDPWMLSFVPVVSPAVEGQQVFLNHPGVAVFKRNSYVRFHTRRPQSPVTQEMAGDLEHTIADLGAMQLGVTLGHLAKGLPIYEVRFAEDQSFEVNHVGEV